jgi:glutathione S-transferase
MMKLFYSPGACSLAAHVALEELGAPYEAVLVNVAQGDQRKPEFLALNPKGRVPFLVTEQGGLSESVAILTYLADRRPDLGLLPADPWSRAQALSFVTWCAGTVHGTAFAGVFRSARFADDETAHPAIKEKGTSDVRAHLATINERVTGRDYVMDHFTIADLYPMIFRRWAARVGLDMGAYPALLAHAERIASRPAAARAIAQEGIRLDG